MNRIFCLLCLTAAITACATGTPTPADAPAVHEKRLGNGLKVLVKPDTRAPIVVSQIWYKVGGSYEPDGRTGASHVLEHMMFKGTSSLEPNEFSRIISALGGQDNAFTGRDYTAYFQTLEKSHLETAFRFESERMYDLVFDQAEFEKEIEVVKEERRTRTDDRPDSLTYERFMAEAFRQSSYRNPIIGWPEDLEAMRLKDLEHWYSMYYAPNNATLVVVGDVEPDEVFALAQKYFGGIPKRAVPPAEQSEEPAQSAPRRIDVRVRARVPYLLIGYHVPSIASVSGEDEWVPYALEVAAYLFDGGKSARLHSELVRKQGIASSAGASYDPLARKSTIFTFSAHPSQGQTVEDLESAILEQIRIMSEELVADEELERVKAQIVAGKVFEQDSSFYQGMILGLLETSGMSWKLSEEIDDRLRAVTAGQVREVVRRYMTGTNSTVGILMPQGGSGG